MKRGTPEHPKTRRLARALNLEPWGAVGVLESLWHWTARYAPAGDVGRFEDADLADGIGWRGDPAALVSALVACDWIDPSEEYRLVIHDWHEHADEAVHMALARAGKLFADGQMPKLGKLPKEERERVSALFVRTASARQAHNIPSTPPEPRPAPPEPLVGAAPPPAPPPPTGSPGDRAIVPERRSQKAAKTRAPDALDESTLLRLEAWCAEVHPHVSDDVRSLVVACLTHHRANGNTKADWYATAQTWIRNEAEGRFPRRVSPGAPSRAAPQTFTERRIENTKQAARDAFVQIATRRGLLPEGTNGP